MMKSAVVALFLLVSLNSSQASMTQVQQAPQSHKLLELRNRTVTKNALVSAASRKQRKILVLNDLDDDDSDDPPGPDELDLQSPFRRPKIVENPPDDELSDYITVRLAVARAKAMAKYREIY